MTPEQIASEVLRLSVDDRKRVLTLIVDALVQPSSGTQRDKRFAGIFCI